MGLCRHVAPQLHKATYHSVIAHPNLSFGREFQDDMHECAGSAANYNLGLWCGWEKE